MDKVLLNSGGWSNEILWQDDCQKSFALLE